MFVYQSTFKTLKELKELKDKGNYYVTDCKSKGVYSSKLIPLYTTFLHDIKLSGYKKGIKFNKSVLVVKQNIYMPDTSNHRQALYPETNALSSSRTKSSPSYSTSNPRFFCL